MAIPGRRSVWHCRVVDPANCIFIVIQGILSTSGKVTVWKFCAKTREKAPFAWQSVVQTGVYESPSSILGVTFSLRSNYKKKQKSNQSIFLWISDGESITVHEIFKVELNVRR